VPGSPFTPLLAVASCVFLMTQLPWITWVRFFGWLAIGVVVYFAYSYHHSKLRTSAK
jgi:APA family basic amino acid/polyamine antiporter